MKKILIAATLIGAFAAPALAMDSFYVMFDKSTKKCSISTSRSIYRCTPTPPRSRTSPSTTRLPTRSRSRSTAPFSGSGKT